MRRDISLDPKATHYCAHCGLTMNPTDQLECQVCDGDLCEPRKRSAKKQAKAKVPK